MAKESLSRKSNLKIRKGNLMEKLVCAAIYDKKAEVYDTPLFFLKTVGAQRWFYSLVQQGEGRFEHFKNDLELHKIGEFNVTTGKFTLINSKEENPLLMDGVQVEKENKEKGEE